MSNISRELEAVYDSRKSFYRKAFVLKNTNENQVYLESYNTVVAHIDEAGELHVYDTYSRTTLRHIKEFARQYAKLKLYTKREVEKFIN